MDYYIQVTSKTALGNALTNQGFDISDLAGNQTVQLDKGRYSLLLDWIGKVPLTYNADGTPATFYAGQYVLARPLNDDTDLLLQDNQKFAKRIFPAEQIPRVFL